MSSTNRGNSRDFHVSDYYVTPVQKIVDFLMEFFDDNIELDFNGKVILDPCAGGDTKHSMSYPEAIKKWTYPEQPTIKTIDLRQDSLAELKENYLFTKLDYEPDIIITNPPFKSALEIIQKALHDVKEGGLVIMLLRLNFFGSKARFKFWDKNMPSFCYVHSQRLGFTDDGGTDSIEYMHAVWIKGEETRFTKLRVI